MQAEMIRVACPQCRTNYRVDSNAIPEPGATATCKRCGLKFTIQKSATGSLIAKAETPPEKIEPQQDAFLICPVCGHRQAQLFACYACGAVIKPKETALSAVSLSASDSPLKIGYNGSIFGEAMGKIIIRTGCRSKIGLCHFTRPCINIDGMDHHQEWGANAFQVPTGDCTVLIYSQFLFWSFGHRILDVCVSKGENVFLDYQIPLPLMSAPCNIRRASLAEGILWKLSTRADRPPAAWYASRKAVIAGLAFLGPFGLIQLWKSDQFSRPAKALLTAGVVLFFLVVLLMLR